jgi:phosphate-selective porin
VAYPPTINPWGAVEVAARYSSIDLNDDGFDGSGKQENAPLASIITSAATSGS